MKKWIDETGLEIPANRITSLEKQRERITTRIVKKATDVNNRLVALKIEMEAECHDLWTKALEEAGMDENRISKSKGNHTIYNFDRSIKIEVAISDRIEFDDALITAAKAKFDEFLDNGTKGMDELFRGLINTSFETTKGNLDTKKVFDLIRHKKNAPRAKYPLFHEGVELVEQSIRRPDSRKYMRVWTRDDAGKYHNVDLNFSSI